MSHFYNPLQKQDGDCFNSEPRQDFEYISEQERIAALEKLDKLVSDTYENLKED